MDESASVRLMEALAGIWSAIRRHHPDVPPVVVLAAPAPRGQRNVLGHFSALRWKPRTADNVLLHEVVVVAEHLNRTACDIAETLLHEAAHAMNFARGRKDCSASQYHNSWFKEAAEELGLTVAQVKHYGFAYTTLPDDTALRYLDEVLALEEVLVHRTSGALRPTPPPSPPTTGDPQSDADDGAGDKPSSRNIKAVCACGFIIRASRKTLESTIVFCGTCDCAFGAEQ